VGDAAATWARIAAEAPYGAVAFFQILFVASKVVGKMRHFSPGTFGGTQPNNSAAATNWVPPSFANEDGESESPLEADPNTPPPSRTTCR
jgi:hypothetical protein